MKFYSLLFLALAFMAATLGSAVLSGTAATVMQVSFMVLFLGFSGALARGKKIEKSVPGRFATSFKESELA
jgi:uncharacterized membrane protein YtjA (UPF0391 family)